MLILSDEVFVDTLQFAFIMKYITRELKSVENIENSMAFPI